MALGIKKHILSFYIPDSDDSKIFLFEDTSEYFENPEKPLLEVTLPGYNKYVLVNILARKTTVINSNMLGLSEIYGSSDLKDLPDGVWTLKYKICPYDKLYTQRYYLRTTMLEQALDNMFEAFDLTDCEIEKDAKTKQDIVDIFLAIESAKANARQGHAKKASELYQKANSKVVDILNKLKGSC